MILNGKVWKFGDGVDTDVIIPARYGALPIEQYKTHLMEPIRPGWAVLVKEGDFIFAGNNFGIGSSRGQAVAGLKAVGIRAVIAISFGRIFFRSAINEGMALIDCPEAYQHSQEGDQVEIDIAGGVIINKSKNREFTFAAFPDLIQKIILAGGGVNYYKEILNSSD
ncbi:MAG: 3-isopropylmalate dehydratase small subunit [Deltaproteobacteria bacterium]|nr:MAG: 3-isopropylmalate dehydratase small subunit [Deltaproteobacteria bacterium]